MRKRILVILPALACSLAAPRPGATGAAPGGPEKPRFDVCDVTYLWPVPTTRAEVDALTSADDADDSTNSPVWPKAAFDRLLEIATGSGAEITHPKGGVRKIGLRPEFRDRKNWKVVGFRADPGSPGNHSAIAAKFGASPQFRIIVQPVTVVGDTVTVHDFATHLVYSFVKPPAKPEQGFLPVSIPDKEKFRAILDDLAVLKSGLKGQGVDTQGTPLGVHPGLKADAVKADFAARVKAFLLKTVDEKNLTAMAFMGLPDSAPEPWIFVPASRNAAGTFDPARVPALGFKTAQMLDVIDGEPNVFPPAAPTNRNPISNFLGIPPAERRGVSTGVLFNEGLDADAVAVIGQTADGQAVTDPDTKTPLRNKDIPDFVANPQRSHFFSTDCLSCHTESARRVVLKFKDDSNFRYERPEGISGVSPDVLPKESWNVRNLGWFPSFFQQTTTPTVTMRTANETADCVEFINRVYFENGK